MSKRTLKQSRFEKKKKIFVKLTICFFLRNNHIQSKVNTFSESTSNKGNVRRVTRNFLGQWSFLGIGHFDKHSPTTRERKTPQGKNLRFFRLEPVKNCILNEKLYPQITTIRALFPQIRALFSNFRKRAGDVFFSKKKILIFLGMELLAQTQKTKNFKRVSKYPKLQENVKKVSILKCLSCIY